MISRISVILVALLAVATVVLFVDFTFQTFSFRPRDVKTDAIVVLTGGRGRVEEGLRLYRERREGCLLLIGVDPSVRRRDLFKELPGEKILLENVSRTTYENAVYARELIEKQKISSLRLITSRYHMKRALLIFRNVLPKDIAIYPHPVDTGNLKEEWWSHSGSFRLLFSEFYKYCLFRFFFLVASGEARPNL